MTILQAHAHTAQVLEQSLQLPRDEAHARARLLLDWICEERYAHLLSPAQVLATERLQVLADALERASRGEPLPYIVGKQEFWGREFEAGPEILIPRPETELLVETAQKYLPTLEPIRSTLEVADLGTGSGIVAICLALEVERLFVTATDISSVALEVAARNAERHQVADRVRFVLSDEGWLAPLQGQRFDAIVSNPPYIASGEINSLQVEVRDFEPRRALDGGDDGLDVYRLLALEARKYLRAGGFLALELGAGQWDDVADLLRQNNWRPMPALIDFAGIKRVLVAF